MTERIIPKDFYVYAHAKATTGEIFYIGKGGPRQRREKSIRSRNGFWNRTVKKHGFNIIVVRDGLQEWAAFELEREMIALHGRRDLGLGPLVNLTDGGEGPSGAVVGQTTREKMSAVHKGRKHTLESRKKMSLNKVGMTISEQERERLSTMNIGRKHSEAFREKARIASTGRKHTEASREKISLLASARVLTPEAILQRTQRTLVSKTARGIVKPVRCSTGEIFAGQSYAAQWLRENGHEKAKPHAIGDCCKGKFKTAYGYTWAYA
jgi:hypothetical protein